MGFQTVWEFRGFGFGRQRVYVLSQIGVLVNSGNTYQNRCALYSKVTHRAFVFSVQRRGKDSNPNSSHLLQEPNHE